MATNLINSSNSTASSDFLPDWMNSEVMTGVSYKLPYMSTVSSVSLEIIADARYLFTMAMKYERENEMLSLKT